MCGAVIVMLHSRVLWKVHSKDHAMAALSSTTGLADERGDRATPLSETQLMPIAHPSAQDVNDVPRQV